ncbi:MAG: hypothetical protein GY853_13640 [PVC group bacterium]|nr:hypothetical protein [PVC group bacterium]
MDKDIAELLDPEIIAYQRGFSDGLRTYAHMKDGVSYVGTTGRTLGQAITEIKKSWNYSPPKRRK